MRGHVRVCECTGACVSVKCERLLVCARMYVFARLHVSGVKNLGEGVRRHTEQSGQRLVQQRLKYKFRVIALKSNRNFGRTHCLRMRNALPLASSTSLSTSGACR